MSEISQKTLNQRLADDKTFQDIVTQAVQQALREHKQAGNPVATWQNGKVVIVPPEEIVVPEDEDDASA